MTRIGIFGAAGYGGVDLVRMLLNHPQAQLTYLAGNTTVGRKLSEVYPFLVGTCDLPIQEIMFLRTLVASPFLLIMALKQGKPLLAKDGKSMLVRSFLGAGAMLGFYYAITHMPLAECIFLGRTQPMFLACLAPLLIGEKTPRVAWLAIFLGLSGVALIIEPGFSWVSGAWVALLAALLSACAHLMVRKLNRTDEPLTIVLDFTIIAALITGALALPVFVRPSLNHWFLLIGIAIFASMGQLLMTHAYRRDNAPVVAAASYSSVLLSIIYGYMFWGETVKALSILGGLFIVAGGITLVLGRQEKAAQAVAEK